MKRKFLLSACLLSCISAPAFDLGWVIDGPWAAASLRAKIRAVPTFFVIRGGEIDAVGTVTLSQTFSNMIIVCGRNADVDFRLVMRTRKPDVIDPAVFKGLRASLADKLTGMCTSAIELSPWPVLGKPSTVLVPWAKALKTAVNGDFPLKMMIPPVGEAKTPSPHTPKEIAAGVLKEVDGLSLLLSGLNLPKDQYRPLFVQNLLWSNEKAAQSHKTINLVISGAFDINNQPTKAEESLSETFEAFKTIPAKSFSLVCSGKVRFAIASDRNINDVKQDRVLVEMEKWVKQKCPE